MSGPTPDVSCDLFARVSHALADLYALDRVIGTGCMSTVFLAGDLRHDRPVAVKVLRPELAAGIGSERFLTEIRIEASLNHANIVPVFDSGEVDGLLYYVMPYVSGESLAGRLRREPQLELDDALEIAGEVGSALWAAHSKGILHRDIKPANILLGEDRVGVVDFGLARALDQAGAAKLNTVGVAVGTPAYMSPEQGLGEAPLDPRADQYSLACVVHEMLAGEPPFAARSPRALIYTHAARDPPRIRDFRPEVPWAVERVILRALSKAPSARFPTVVAFGEALEKGARGEVGEGSRSALVFGGDVGPRRDPRERIAYRLQKAVLEHPARLTAAVLVFGAFLIAVSILVTLWFLTPEGGA
mgnify:CR=1 FL=1